MRHAFNINEARRIQRDVFPVVARLLVDAGIPERVVMHDRAQAALLAIGFQESAFNHRLQIGGGPAHGYWQFEKGGGVRGVLTHVASKNKIRQVLEARDYTVGNRKLQQLMDDVYEMIILDDVLACACARLLLWTDPFALPSRIAVQSAWEMYAERLWRPGKPHPEKWPSAWFAAWNMVIEGEA